MKFHTHTKQVAKLLFEDRSLGFIKLRFIATLEETSSTPEIRIYCPKPRVLQEM